MAGESPGSDNNAFDIARIRHLVRLMRDNDLGEIDLRFENARIRLKRRSDIVEGMPVAGMQMYPAPGPVSREAAAPAAEAPKPEAKALPTIDSPFVGTFYTAPSPDAESFVAIGTRVAPDTVVCIVEAMKVFNEIPAGMAGVIREILVENGAPVEYGQPLFRVEP